MDVHLPDKIESGRAPKRQAERRGPGSVKQELGICRSALLQACAPCTVADVLALMPQERAVAAHLPRVCEALENMNPKTYRSLCGFLNAARNPICHATVEFPTETRRLLEHPDTSPEERRILALLLEAHGLYRRTLPPAFSALRYFGRPLFGVEEKDEPNMNFATKALLLVRICHDLGINMLNPSGDPARPMGIPAGQSFRITNRGLTEWDDKRKKRMPLQNGQIICEPQKDGVLRIRYVHATTPDVESPRNTWTYEKRLLDLAPGSAALVGPALSIRSLGFPLRRRLLIPPDCDTGSDTFWSRIAILIVHDGEKIRLYDRGSLNALFIDREEYPRTICYESISEMSDGLWQQGCVTEV